MLDYIINGILLFWEFVKANPTFCLLAFVIIASALYVVVLKNIFHCALFLVLCLFAVAGIYILLEAEFLAAVQILIYVGAVSILIIFAIMLTSRLASEKIKQSNDQVMLTIFICAGFLLVTLGSIAYSVWRIQDDPLPENNTLTLGELLMTDYVLPFEVVSVLLLAAMIGAIVLARREKS
jgi:NADH:ubiquinone oxidoreductase subunit 6 (subunit J)